MCVSLHLVKSNTTFAVAMPASFRFFMYSATLLSDYVDMILVHFLRVSDYRNMIAPLCTSVWSPSLTTTLSPNTLQQKTSTSQSASPP